MALVLLTLSLAGCYAVRVNTSARHSTHKESTLEWHFFWGLTPARVATNDCPSGIAEVRVNVPWWSFGCLGPLTLGIVYASKVTWTCTDAPPAITAPVHP
jgi:hypothetical protein